MTGELFKARKAEQCKKKVEELGAWPEEGKKKNLPQTQVIVQTNVVKRVKL